ncbi:putative dnaJ molecular chaperone homology domain [Lyophyllum shimeji]|uniref:DnaJ molecular chaperone homology domain n=1 Tax=Lyophyllum shimeji TaxID=47721 RepID=A0A9P3PTZ4_LYOSH|nr:putative dnaJ molecular chaperone homology domain [Lyophyllum shimeji]
MASMLLVETFGFFFIGAFFAVAMYSINNLQIVGTLSLVAKRRPLSLGLYIILIWLLDCLHINAVVHMAFEYLIIHPITPESKIIKYVSSHILIQKIMFPLTQGVSIWRIWTLTSRCQRVIPVLLAILVLANLGAGLYVHAEVSKLSLIVELREAPLTRAVMYSFGATAALETLLTVSVNYISAPALRKPGLWAAWKTVFSLRAIISGCVGYLMVTGSRLATFTFMFLSAEAVLTKLYVSGSISVIFDAMQRASPPKVLIGRGRDSDSDSDSLHYVIDNEVVKMELSQELAAELKKVLARVRGEELETEGDPKNEEKEVPSFTDAEPLASDKGELMVLASSTAPRLSNGTQQYPYPTNARPTPYQIFHLCPGASQAEIKARYYDLVRAHHPDSLHCRALSPSERHARFQAITAAYDVLRGKRSSATPNSAGYDPYMEEVLRRKRYYEAHYARRAQYAGPHAQRAEWHASEDDRWKDGMMLLVGLVTLVAGLAPGFFVPSRMEKQHRAAVSNLSQARREARELAEERRDELRKRAQQIKAQASVSTTDAKEERPP